MATWLYNAEGEKQSFEPQYVTSELEGGAWFAEDPTAVIANTEPETVTGEPNTDSTVDAAEDEPEQTEAAGNPLNPVRIAAQEAGIEGWDTKRIGTLEKELGE